MAAAGFDGGVERGAGAPGVNAGAYAENRRSIRALWSLVRKRRKGKRGETFLANFG